MSKKRRTVSLDPAVDEHLSSEGVNASQLVNRLVKHHASSGGDEKAMLELRAEQLRSDINELQGRIESKQDELETVESRLEEYRTEREEVIEQAAEILTLSDVEKRNQKTEYWASEAEMPIEDFARAVKDSMGYT